MKLLILITTFFALNQHINAKVCTYSLDKSSVKLKWTGFKTTKKVAVSGTFKNITWSSQPSKSLDALMKTIKFKIKTSSVESGNSIRDKRMYKNFFKLMSDGDQILGHGISLDKKNKLAVIEVDMNKERTPIIFGFNLNKDNTFSLKGSIDILKHYKMSAAYKSLAKLCSSLHTGTDGISKTWTDVELAITGKIICTPHGI